MRRRVLAAVLVVFGSGAMLARAQQQTGAPGGIVVPAPPAGSTFTPSTQQAGSAVFRVRVLDGRNGTPLRNAHVTLWYDEVEGAGTLLTTDAQGLAAMPAPVGQPLRVLVRLADLVDCRRKGTYDVPTGFNMQAIAQHGESANNQCGIAGKHPSPGELVVFARPPRWYESINQGSGIY